MFYAVAWICWFATFVGDFNLVARHFIQGWSIGASGWPLLIQLFALGTAIFSTCALYALEELDWF